MMTHWTFDLLLVGIALGYLLRDVIGRMDDGDNAARDRQAVRLQVRADVARQNAERS
jgi:hypothetical protein